MSAERHPGPGDRARQKAKIRRMHGLFQDVGVERSGRRNLGRRLGFVLRQRHMPEACEHEQPLGEIRHAEIAKRRVRRKLRG